MSGDEFTLNCPMPFKNYSRILLGHGSGGELTHELMDKIFGPAFDNPLLRQAHDGAVSSFEGKRFAMTTDSYVVQPLFFPGGDIGTLAVYGSVNDLAMCGARPLYLSAAFILEEGFEISLLAKIVDSMKQAAARCRVSIITGDTKVVNKGKGDGVFINTTGVGVLEHDRVIGPGSIREGDAIILSGDIGRHGMAIMAAREGLSVEKELLSDVAPLADGVLALLNQGVSVHCLRDLTRGGLATALVELARTSGKQMHIEESQVKVIAPVRGLCEILGLDALYVANEGRFICFVPEKEVPKTLEILKAYPEGQQACCIGHVGKTGGGRVVLKNRIGTERILDLFLGELLPRIC